MLLQAGLCRTWSETTLVFPRGGSYFILLTLIKNHNYYHHRLSGHAFELPHSVATINVFSRNKISPGKIVFGIVPSKNDNQCPRKSGLSSLFYCLLCLPLCRARCLSFRLKLSGMASLLGKSLSFCSLCVFQKNVLLCFMYFLSHLVSMLGLSLIVLIPGPSILTSVMFLQLKVFILQHRKNEPPHWKTNNLHRRKQRCRSALH